MCAHVCAYVCVCEHVCACVCMADRVKGQWASMGGDLTWRNLQTVINEVFDVPEGKTCPDWKARKVYSLLSEGAWPFCPVCFV